MGLANITTGEPRCCCCAPMGASDGCGGRCGCCGCGCRCAPQGRRKAWPKSGAAASTAATSSRLAAGRGRSLRRARARLLLTIICCFIGLVWGGLEGAVPVCEPWWEVGYPPKPTTTYIDIDRYMWM